MLAAVEFATAEPPDSLPFGNINRNHQQFNANEHKFSWPVPGPATVSKLSVSHDITNLNKVKPTDSVQERVTINISGMRFETFMSTLERFPNTLLGNPSARNQYFDEIKKEFFFERHRQSFEAILYYYQSFGKLQRPSGIPVEMFYEELKFFELEEEILDRFCETEGYITEFVNVLPENPIQRKIWLLFEFPDSSVFAVCIAVYSVIVILLSIVLFCVETLPQFRYYKAHSINITNVNLSNVEFIEDGIPDVTETFFIIESFCMTWFVFEIVIRFCSSPEKLKFCKSFMNIVDIIAILPYFIGLSTIIIGDNKNQNHSMVLSILRVLRLIRVFRIFKLSRYSKGLQILGQTLKASLNELLLLVFFLCISVILFSSVIYFTESDAEITYFHSIPDAFWWTIITMTTVGYGDMYPMTLMGRIVGGLCAIAGVLTISLPVPVIVSNFNYYYHKASESKTKQIYVHVGKRTMARKTESKHLTMKDLRPMLIDPLELRTTGVSRRISIESIDKSIQT